MSYNKAKAEQQWLQWKNSEEKQLRILGVSEDIIQRLRTYDWQVFKEERNYPEKRLPWMGSVDTYIKYPERSIRNIESLLDDIEDMELFHALVNEDRVTLEILFYKILGYTSKEISQHIGMKENTVDQRISRLKKKL